MSTRPIDIPPTRFDELLKNRREKCLIIYSADRLVSEEKKAHCVSYIRSVMDFMGIEEFEAIAIKGADAIQKKARECIDEEIIRALQSV